jgi:Rad3-related DNA helicase
MKFDIEGTFKTAPKGESVTNIVILCGYPWSGIDQSQASIDVEQAIGRSSRNPGDIGVVFAIDHRFTWLPITIPGVRLQLHRDLESWMTRSNATALGNLKPTG